MKKVELYLDGLLVDVNKVEPILTSYILDDIYNPGKIHNSSSKSLILPNTPTNNKVFGKIWDVRNAVQQHSTERAGKYFNPSKKCPFQLFVDDEKVYEGYIKLNEINFEGTGWSYNITMYGILGDLFSKVVKVGDNEFSFNQTLGEFFEGTDNPYGKNKILLTPGVLENCFKIRQYSNNNRFTSVTGIYTPQNYTGIDIGYNFNTPSTIFNLYMDYIDSENGLYNEGKSLVAYDYLLEEYNDTPIDFTYSENEVCNKLAHKQRFGFYQDMLIGAMFKKIGYDLLESDWVNYDNPYWTNTLISGQILDKDFGELINSELRSEVIYNFEDTLSRMYLRHYESDGLSEPITGASLETTDITFGSTTKTVRCLKFDTDDVLNSYVTLNGLNYSNTEFVINSSLIDVGDSYPFFSGNLIVTCGYITKKASETNSSIYTLGAVNKSITVTTRAGANIDGNNNNELNIYEGRLKAVTATTLVLEIKVKSINSWVTLGDFQESLDKLKLSIDLPTTFLTIANTVMNDILFNEYLIFNFTGSPIITLKNSTNASLRIFEVLTNPYYLTITKLVTSYKIGNFSRIKYNKLLPSVKAIDYLLSYLKYFGLYLDIDEMSKTVRLLTRNEYYGGEDYVVKDISFYENKYDVIPLNFKDKYIELKLKDGKTGACKNYKDRRGREYTSLKLNTGYEFNDSSYDYFKGIVFEPLIFSELRSTIYGNDIDPKIQPQMYEGETLEKSKNYNPISLIIIDSNYYSQTIPSGVFLNDVNSGLYFLYSSNYYTTEIENKKTGYNFFNWSYKPDAAGIINYVSGSVYGNRAIPGEYTKYIPCTNTFTNGTSNYSIDLYKPDELYNNLTYPDNISIYDRLHKAYLEDRYNVNTKVLTGQFYLPYSEKRSLKLSDFIYLEDRYWAIDKIEDLDLVNENTPVKLTLISINDITNYTQGQNLT